jgi:hypothetical protein
MAAGVKRFTIDSVALSETEPMRKASKLTAIRFNQAANLVDDPANPHARVVLIKSANTAETGRDWRADDADYLKRKDINMSVNTNTDMADTDDLDAMIDYAAKLGAQLDRYGDAGALPADHPVHQLRAVHKEMVEGIAAERRNRKRAPAALGSDTARHATSDPFDADLVKRSFEDALQVQADRLALEKGITSEKAYVELLASHQAIHKGFRRDRDPGGSSLAQQRAWTAIEAVAERLVQKSAAGITHEQAIDRVMKSNPALVRAYYGIDVDPVNDRGR